MYVKLTPEAAANLERIAADLDVSPEELANTLARRVECGRAARIWLGEEEE